MSLTVDTIDRALLDNWQRDFPLVPRPFAAIAERMELRQKDVLSRLAELMAVGAVSRKSVV